MSLELTMFCLLCVKLSANWRLHVLTDKTKPYLAIKKIE